MAHRVPRGRGRQQQDEAAALAQEELDLIDALRAWHRFQHGDESGAMEDFESGVQLSEEMENLLLTAAQAQEDYEVLAAVAEDYGHDSEMFDDAARAYLSSLGRVCEASAAMQPADEEAPAAAGARGPRRAAPASRGAPPGRPGPGRGAAPKSGGARAAAAGMAGMGGMPPGGLVGGAMNGGMPNPGEVLPPAGSPMDLSKIGGLPPPLSGGGGGGAPGWGNVGKSG